VTAIVSLYYFALNKLGCIGIWWAKILDSTKSPDPDPVVNFPDLAKRFGSGFGGENSGSGADRIRIPNTAFVPKK
jgi:hypothetical protein